MLIKRTVLLCFTSPRFTSPRFTSPRFNSPRFTSPRFTSPCFTSPRLTVCRLFQFRIQMDSFTCSDGPKKNVKHGRAYCILIREAFVKTKLKLKWRESAFDV